jgi:hypothetical protein
MTAGKTSGTWRGTVAAVVGAAIMIGGGAVAHADDVANNVDMSIDAEAEVMNLTAGGPTRITELSIRTANDDGKNVCNLTGQTILTTSVNSSNSSVAAVSPGSVTFDSCGDVQTLTVTPLSGGTTTVSLSQVSNTTGATFNLAPATFTVNVTPTAPANTPPTVIVTEVAAATSYEKGAVPAAGCSVTDAQDGNSSFAASLSAITGPRSAFGLGDQTATCSYTDNGGLTTTASVAYSIVDTQKPLIAFESRSPAVNGNGWNNSVVAVTWQCSDGTGSGVVADTVSATVDAEGANLSATGTCSDHAGNTASATETNIKIDTTAPVTTFKSKSPAGEGWSNTDVVVTWSCSDDGSGVLSAEVSATTGGEGDDRSATGTCKDLAGNTSQGSVGDIKVDKTPPSITFESRTAANDEGWNKGDVDVTWSCTDDGSGPVATSVTETVSGEGENLGATGTCTDVAGNTASDTQTGINIDRTKPTVRWDGGPAGGSTYFFGSVPSEPTCTASDALSGGDECTVSGYGTTVGPHTMATDMAGNVETVTRSYTVAARSLHGFFQPVDMGNVWNTVKAGSTVPLKFEVFAGSTELTNPAIIETFSVKSVTCPGASTPTDEIEFTTTGGTALWYSDGQFIQNWQTPKGAGGCYRVTLTADDNSAVNAQFKLK